MFLCMETRAHIADKQVVVCRDHLPHCYPEVHPFWCQPEAVTLVLNSQLNYILRWSIHLVSHYQTERFLISAPVLPSWQSPLAKMLDTSGPNTTANININCTITIYKETETANSYIWGHFKLPVVNSLFWKKMETLNLMLLVLCRIQRDSCSIQTKFVTRRDSNQNV